MANERLYGELGDCHVVLIDVAVEAVLFFDLGAVGAGDVVVFDVELGDLCFEVGNLTSCCRDSVRGRNDRCLGGCDVLARRL